MPWMRIAPMTGSSHTWRSMADGGQDERCRCAGALFAPVLIFMHFCGIISLAHDGSEMGLRNEDVTLWEEGN